MILLYQFGAAGLLVILTLLLQCVGAAGLIKWLRSITAGDLHQFRMFNAGVLVMQTTSGVIVLHGLIILLWASCYRWLCFYSWEPAFYFSASSYSTVGYGDVVLPSRWRLLGPLESMLGVLMCGISVSLLFVLVSRLVNSEVRPRPLNQASRDLTVERRIN